MDSDPDSGSEYYMRMAAFSFTVFLHQAEVDIGV